LPGPAPDAVRALAYTVAAISAIDDARHEALANEWFQAATRLTPRERQPHPLLRLVGPLYAAFSSWVWGGGPASPAALDGLRTDPDPWVRGTALLMRAQITLSVGRRLPEALADLTESLAAYRLSGDRWGTGTALMALAELTAWRGEFSEAARHTAEAVALMSEVGSVTDVVFARTQLARLSYLRGDREA